MLKAFRIKHPYKMFNDCWALAIIQIRKGNLGQNISVERLANAGSTFFFSFSSERLVYIWAAQLQSQLVNWKKKSNILEFFVRFNFSRVTRWSMCTVEINLPYCAFQITKVIQWVTIKKKKKNVFRNKWKLLLLDNYCKFEKKKKSK